MCKTYGLILYISMHILHTVSHTFTEVLTGRICPAIKSFFRGDYFLNFCDLFVNLVVLLWGEKRC